MPCEQMGWLSWQPRAWDAQLAEGNGAELLGAPVQMPIPPQLPWEEQAQGCLVWARGVSQQR